MNQSSSVLSLNPIPILIYSNTKTDGQRLGKKIDKDVHPHLTIATQKTVEEEVTALPKPLILLIEKSLSDNHVVKFVEHIMKTYDPSDVGIFCLCRQSDNKRVASFAAHGLIDFQPTPVTAEILNARIALCHKNLVREKALKDAYIRDPLTSLPNRQHFLDQAKNLYASAKRDQIELMMAIIEPDHLGRINRHYGQTVGDDILQETAEILSKRKRDTDLLCRFDGSKFVLLAVNMAETHLITFLDDMLASLQAHAFKAGAQKLWITGSIGATSYLGRDIVDMVYQAEEALFQSRENGHNRFTILNEMTSDPVPVRSFI